MANAPSDTVAVISYDEKPGMQAIGSTAPDLPTKPGAHAACYELKDNRAPTVWNAVLAA